MTHDPQDLSDMFFARWIDACGRMKVDPIDLIRVSYSEAGCRAAAHNPHGDASGLLQFMPQTLMGMGWTKGHEAFRKLDAADQIPWVERYIAPHASWCTSDALCYVAVFLPALGPKASQMGDEFVLCGQRGPLAWAYGANRVLDKDGDGSITVADLGRQLSAQCKGARWDAVLWRLREAMGLQPPSIPPPPDTQPEILPQLNTPIMTNAADGLTCYPLPPDPDDAA